jgi:hypothetical protein
MLRRTFGSKEEEVIGQAGGKYILNYTKLY